MKAKKEVKQSRNRYSPEFKKQALERADKDGIATVARDLGLKDTSVKALRKKAGWGNSSLQFVLKQNF